MSFPSKRIRTAIFAGVASCLAFAGAHAEETTGVFKDSSRIVAVGGAITEIVYALGEQDHLVARDSTGLYPPEAAKLPDVGYMRALSPEGVLSVNPTGILALNTSGPKETIDVLKKASVPYIEVPETFDHEGVVEKIRIVGTALGADDKAEKLVAAVETKLEAAEKLTSGINERKRVLFILSVQDGKIMGSGTGTAANGIIQLAGGVNAIEGFPGYKQLSDEAILTAAPDVILMMNRGGDHAAASSEILSLPALASTPAGKAGKLVRMDGGYLLGFGPRTADAVHDLAVALYGDELKD
ncbi:hemin ABC transporter substrate-binding protein [Mesorhizobium sp. SB112]|uniref:heme/hemin ABC transporter substrate-binding protein n=1 Tax=Mesorhizobium sp. SB112 TaxID=3151853 RepID=UPI003263C72D